MAVYNYAEQFTRILQQKYSTELKSYALTQSNQGIKFLNAQTIKLPTLTLSGYKDHTRTRGFNAGSAANDWIPKKLEHDRDIEFWFDPMDIDETNLVLEAANVTNTFEDEHAIPEKDSYRFSKLFSEVNTFSGVVDHTVLDAANFLEIFDEHMAKMDDAGVPEEGRIMYITPSTKKIVKVAEGIERSIIVSTPNTINRKVHSLDDVEFITVPAARMKTLYDFTDGCVADPTAKQINFILVHPSCVVCRDKYEYIKWYTPGHDSYVGDGHLYQNRNYGDIFLLEKKIEGITINAQA
ncbi:capsid protein [Clostridium intestinale]|uniref:Capsid protein n=1 Tax=Clostridium intestinale TaxID=36845 RepID=A0A7D6VNT0_9CLOT|nr:capsid protein [Clostridium intestinale]QLY79187.1 capsid protein [Clostridium intestinale]